MYPLPSPNFEIINRVILIGGIPMLYIDESRKTLTELRKTTKLLEERNFFVDTTELMSRKFSDVLNEYRSVYLPITTGVPANEYTIDLFDSFSKSRVASTVHETVKEVVDKLNKAEITYLNPIAVLTYNSSKYNVDPHRQFDIHGVKPGFNPNQPIDPETASDIICIQKNKTLFPPNLLWTVGDYFYYGSRLKQNNFYLEGANDYIRNSGSGPVIGSLSLTDMNCDLPKTFKGIKVEDGYITLPLPADYNSGALIFIAGKPFFDLRDRKDIVLSSSAIKIPLAAFNLSITHLGKWMEDFKVDVEDIRDILDHPTSFWVPFANELFTTYEELKNNSKDSFHIQSDPIEYDGELLVDVDNALVPFLTCKFPVVDKELYMIESYRPKKENHLTKANYLIERGVVHDVVGALSNIGIGLYREVKTNSFGLLALHNLTNLEFLEEEIE